MKIIQTIIHDQILKDLLLNKVLLIYGFIIASPTQKKKANKMSHASLNVSVYKLTTYIFSSHI